LTVDVSDKSCDCSITVVPSTQLSNLDFSG